MRSAIFSETSYDYGALIRPNTTIILEEQKRAIQEMAYVIENLIYNITEILVKSLCRFACSQSIVNKKSNDLTLSEFLLFQPNKGVLGTHRKSLIFELIRSDQKFPSDYFYTFEKVSFVFKSLSCFVSLKLFKNENMFCRR